MSENNLFSLSSGCDASLNCGGGGGGTSLLANLLDYEMSQSGTTSSAICNGYSIHYSSAACGQGGSGNGRVVITSPTQTPTVNPTTSPTSATPIRAPTVIPTTFPTTATPTTTRTSSPSCPQGEFKKDQSSSSSSSACQVCPIGTFEDHNECIECAMGTYSNVIGSTAACLPCPWPSYTDGTGFSSCSGFSLNCNALQTWAVLSGFTLVYLFS